MATSNSTASVTLGWVMGSPLLSVAGTGSPSLSVTISPSVSRSSRYSRQSSFSQPRTASDAPRMAISSIRCRWSPPALSGGSSATHAQAPAMLTRSSIVVGLRERHRGGLVDRVATVPTVPAHACVDARTRAVLPARRGLGVTQGNERSAVMRHHVVLLGGLALGPVAAVQRDRQVLGDLATLAADGQGALAVVLERHVCEVGTIAAVLAVF